MSRETGCPKWTSGPLISLLQKENQYCLHWAQSWHVWQKYLSHSPPSPETLRLGSQAREETWGQWKPFLETLTWVASVCSSPEGDLALDYMERTLDLVRSWPQYCMTLIKAHKPLMFILGLVKIRDVTWGRSHTNSFYHKEIESQGSGRQTEDQGYLSLTLCGR